MRKQPWLAKSRSVWSAPYSGALARFGTNTAKSAGIRRTPDASRGSWIALPLRRSVVVGSALMSILTVVRAEIIQSDICIYGGTAAGMAAGIQAARMGKSVVIAEFGNHVGG